MTRPLPAFPRSLMQEGLGMRLPHQQVILNLIVENKSLQGNPKLTGEQVSSNFVYSEILLKHSRVYKSDVIACSPNDLGIRLGFINT